MTALVHKNSIYPKLIAHPKDPPGQKTTYILPGDYRNETYRLSTFKKYPFEIDAYKLAKNGFYFTGYKDRVKCFSCGMAVENCSDVQTLEFTQWHNEDCLMLRGTGQAENILLRNRPSAQQKNSQNQYTTSSQSSNFRIPTGGEVLMSGLGEYSDHSFLYQTNQENTIISQLHNSSQNLSFIQRTNPESEVENRTRLFPCNNAVNPHMHNCQVRLQTFADRAEYWPGNRINATPQQIAEAGFYYLGERDRVKCWYCNGGLQNWEREDDAWEEHAKWFPRCEFLLQQMGPEYVHNIVSHHPNLQRPPLYNPAENVLFNLNNRNLSASQNSAPVIIDPRKKLEEQKTKIRTEMESSEMVSNAKILGFDEKTIEKALERQYQQHNETFSTFEEMVEGMQALDDDDQDDVIENQSTISNLRAKIPSEKSEFEKLKEERKCRSCRIEDSCMVFIPCGHLACCLKCGEKVKKCLICSSFISERIRSYLS